MFVTPVPLDVSMIHLPTLTVKTAVEILYDVEERFTCLIDGSPRMTAEAAQACVERIETWYAQKSTPFTDWLTRTLSFIPFPSCSQPLKDQLSLELAICRLTDQIHFRTGLEETTKNLKSLLGQRLTNLSSQNQRIRDAWRRAPRDLQILRESNRSPGKAHPYFDPNAVAEVQRAWILWIDDFRREIAKFPRTHAYLSEMPTQASSLLSSSVGLGELYKLGKALSSCFAEMYTGTILTTVHTRRMGGNSFPQKDLSLDDLVKADIPGSRQETSMVHLWGALPITDLPTALTISEPLDAL
jgi:hypothetical protein